MAADTPPTSAALCAGCLNGCSPHCVCPCHGPKTSAAAAVRDPDCTCEWSPVVGRLLCPACVEAWGREAERAIREVRRRVATVVETCLENPAIPRNSHNFGRQVAAMLAADGLLATEVPDGE